MRCVQVLTDGQVTIRGQTADVRRSLDDAEEQSVGRIQKLKRDLVPEVRKYDKM